jgi:hypothetical protein
LSTSDDPSQWTPGAFSSALFDVCSESKFSNWPTRAAMIDSRRTLMRMASAGELSPFEASYQQVLAARKQARVMLLASRHAAEKRQAAARIASRKAAVARAHKHDILVAKDGAAHADAVRFAVGSSSEEMTAPVPNKAPAIPAAPRSRPAPDAVTIVLDEPAEPAASPATPAAAAPSAPAPPPAQGTSPATAPLVSAPTPEPTVAAPDEKPDAGLTKDASHP